MLFTIFYFIEKILPRIIIAALITFFLEPLLTPPGAFIVVFIIAIFLIYKYFPPGIPTLYLMQKTNSEEEKDKIFLELWRESKGMISGVSHFENSYVIKSLSKVEVMKKNNRLRNDKNIDNHKESYHNYSLKDNSRFFEQFENRCRSLYNWKD